MRQYLTWYLEREVKPRSYNFFPADEAGVSKTTLLKHLRKAESKLLDPGDPGSLE